MENGQWTPGAVGKGASLIMNSWSSERHSSWLENGRVVTGVERQLNYEL